MMNEKMFVARTRIDLFSHYFFRFSSICMCGFNCKALDVHHVTPNPSNGTFVSIVKFSVVNRLNYIYTWGHRKWDKKKPNTHAYSSWHTFSVHMWKESNRMHWNRLAIIEQKNQTDWHVHMHRYPFQRSSEIPTNTVCFVRELNIN